MSLFIELTTSAFDQVFQSQLQAGQLQRRAGSSSVRRPLRGLEVKDDTYALFRVIQSDGTEIPLIDSGDPSGTNRSYSNFILQSVQEARLEKHQIVETFGDTYIFFFGEQPRFLDVSAILVNSNDFNWKAEFLANYDQYLRGTRLAELGAAAYLFYDDNIVTGYLMQCQVVDDANNPLVVQLQFRMLLTNYGNISFVGDPNFPLRASVQLPPNVAPGDLTTQANPDFFQNLINQGGGVGGTVVDGQYVTEADLERQIPLRGLISANTDEWTGDPPPIASDPNNDPFVSTTQEVRDINIAIANILAPAGVDSDYANGPDFMDDSGLSPTFSASVGGNTGFGASGSAGATFGASVSFSAGFGGAPANSDPASNAAAAQQNATTLASSSPTYQDFLNGIVNLETGQSTGGSGIDGGFSTGPSLGVGVSSGVGLGASYSGSSGTGAGVSVGGQPSVFSMTVAPGSFPP